MATPKKVRTVKPQLLPATVNNLNFAPEKKGPDELVERVYLSVKFIIKDMEIDELVSAKANPLKLLWHTDGTVMFRDLGPLKFELEAEGTVQIGTTEERLITFEGATLRKIAITPHIERQAEVKCLIGIDPSGHLEVLAVIRCLQDCVFSFDGKDAAKDDGQKTLDV